MKAKTAAEPVLLVGGTDEFQRRRFVSKIVSSKSKGGWTVTPVDGSEAGSLDPIFAMATMFEGQNLAVVSNAEKLSPKIVEEHLKDPDPKVTLLLLSESDSPKGPVFDLVPKSHVKIFSLPVFYKMEEYATDFVVQEAKGLGHHIDEKLAKSLVRKVGLDLGVLSFEIQKASMLVAKGDPITIDVVKKSLAPLSDTDGTAIVEALGVRNAPTLASELTKFRKARGIDPTIELCGRVLTPTFTRWLQAAHLSKVGMSPAAAAGSVGANPWYWEHKVLPPAQLWGVSGCAKLIRIVARSQTLVFQGAVSPFGYLEASLLATLLG